MRRMILMRTVICTALLAVSTVCMALPAVSEAWTPQTTDAAEVDSIVTALVKTHNHTRVKAGLSPLKMNTKLMQAAQVHVHDMAKRERLTHRGKGRTTPAQRVKQQGYSYLKTAENIASGSQTPEAVTQAWMRSRGHWRNILGDFTEVGAAYALSKDGVPYWCVVFGLPIPVLDPSHAAATLVTLLNEKRVNASLPPLEVDARLTQAAHAYARDMAENDTLRHQGGGGDMLLERVAQTGYRARKVGQGIVSGHPTPADVVRRMMDHTTDFRTYILDDFTHIGVSYATAEDGTPYWCVIFGVPRRG